MLGATLALKPRGRFGLLFIDGHADFYQPEVNPNGEAASMDHAFAPDTALLCLLLGYQSRLIRWLTEERCNSDAFMPSRPPHLASLKNVSVALIATSSCSDWS